MRRLRICFTSNSSPWTKFHGGGQIVVHNLARALTNMGHQVTVLYTGPRLQRSTKIPETNYHVEWASYIGYPWKAVFRQMNAYTVYQKLRNLLEKHKFNVINAIGEEALLIPKLCKKIDSFFFFSVEHPSLSDIKPTLSWDKPLKSLLSILRIRDLLINRYVCCRAHGIITPSQYTKSEVVNHFNIKPSKIRVINHGIIDNMLVENSNLNQHDPKGPLLFFGRLEPQKGVDLLLMAYQKLIKKKVISAQDLILIGSGPQEEDYRKIVRNLGLSDRVHFNGWQSPNIIRKQMSEVSLCVLPSRSESFGLSMAETLAQGIPLVTTSAGSIPEVTDSYRGGWIAKPNDKDSLFEVICKALKNYPESLRKAKHGRDYVRRKFTWYKAAKNYESFYTDILNNNVI